jgi:hypothetical protein
MLKLLFEVVVGLLLFVLLANLVGWMMPVLTHPIATVIFLVMFVLFAKAVFKRSGL